MRVRVALYFTLIVFNLMPSLTECADLMSYYNIAVEQDPKLRGARYKHDAVKETLRQAWAKFLPMVSAEANAGQTSQDVISSENQVYAKEKTEYFSQRYSAQVVQPLFHLEHFHTLSQAEVTLNKGDMELLLEEQDLLARVTELYFGVLMAIDSLQSIQEEETALEMHLKIAEEKHRKGLIALTDLQDAEARLDVVTAQKIDGERILNTSIQAFMEVTGAVSIDVNAMTPTAPINNPSPDNVETWVETGRIKNPPLIIKRLEAKEYNYEVKRQKAGHYPTVDLVSRGNWDDEGGSLYGGGSVVNSFEVMGKITVPLYSGGMTESKVQEALALEQKTLQEVVQLDRQAVRQIHDFFFGVKSAIKKVGALAKTVKSQSLLLEAKSRGYDSGLYDTSTVLDAAKDLAVEKRNYAKARYDYVVNLIKLKQSAGTLTVDDLKTINTWLH
jgi:outer membrane protein